MKYVVCIQYVRKYKDSWGINMNNNPFVIFQDKLVQDKQFQLRKYGDIDILVAHADLVQLHHHDLPPSDHTAVGRIAASTTCCVRTTAALCSIWYNCCCLLVSYEKIDPQMNTRKGGEIVCFIALSDLHQPHHDPPIWHLAILRHDDRDAATVRYRPASRAQWPEQSRELTPLRGRPCSLRLLFYVCA